MLVEQQHSTATLAAAEHKLTGMHEMSSRSRGLVPAVHADQLSQALRHSGHRAKRQQLHPHCLAHRQLAAAAVTPFLEGRAAGRPAMQAQADLSVHTQQKIRQVSPG